MQKTCGSYWRNQVHYDRLRSPNLSALLVRLLASSQLLRESPIRSISLALAMLAVAVGARLLVGMQHTSFPFLTFIPAVALSALLCGVWPAVMVATLGALFADFMLIAPIGGLSLAAGDLVGLAVYFFVAWVLIIISQALREALARQQQLAEDLAIAAKNGGLAVWEYDTRTSVTRANTALNLLLGLPDEIVPSPDAVKDAFAPGEFGRLQEVAARAIRGGVKSFALTLEAAPKIDTRRWFSIRAAIEEVDPFGARLRGVIVEVTNEKLIELALTQATIALKSKDEQLNFTMEAARLAPFDFDFVKGVAKPSPRMNEMYGYPPSQILTLSDIRARYHPAAAEDIIRENAVLVADPSQRFFDIELRLLLPSNEERLLRGRGEFVRDDSGKALRAYGLVMEVPVSARGA